MTNVVRLIDHAVLHPTQTDSDLRAACAMSSQLGVASVCVKPYMVPLTAELLRDSSVVVSTVIGFPHGSATTPVKMFEARLACQQGATELDMVINIARALECDWDYLERDIGAVVELGRDHNALVKVIFETDFITRDDHKIRLCQISEAAGAAFVKTSTGFGFVKQSDGQLRSLGATDHDVALMRVHSGEHVGVKASGGIRSYADAIRLVNLGATRLGTSATETIAAEQQRIQSGEMDETRAGDSQAKSLSEPHDLTY